MKNKISSLALAVSSFLLLAAVIGCSESSTPADHTEVAGLAAPDSAKELVRPHYTRPAWSVQEMVDLSDAVLIGSITRDLGGKTMDVAGQDDLDYKFKDYAFEVTEVLYPKIDDGFPSTVAILVEDGMSSTDPNVKVITSDDDPVFTEEQDILVFLESLASDELFSKGAGRPVPSGYTKNLYFQVLIGGKYGKLVKSKDKWVDGVSGLSVSRAEIDEAIDKRND